MADVTEKQFSELIAEQKASKELAVRAHAATGGLLGKLVSAQNETTTTLARSLMSAEERAAADAEASRQNANRVAGGIAAAATRQSNAEAAALVAGKNQSEESSSLLSKIGKGFTSFFSFNKGSASADKEDDNKKAGDLKKGQDILSKISGGITGLGKSFTEGAKEKMKKGFSGFMSILKKFAIGGLMTALLLFMNSSYWEDTKKFISEKIMPAFKSFGESIMSGGKKLIALFKSTDDDGNPVSIFSRIGAIFSPDSALVLGLLGIVGLFAGAKILKLLGPLKGAIGGLLKGVGGLASKIPGIPGGGKAGAASSVAGKAGGAAGKGGGLGKGIGKGIAGLLKGIASGLGALANPATLIGLAAVVLAVNGIALAIRIMSPAFEPIGKMFESFGKTIKTIFNGLGDTIKDIGTSISTVINAIGDNIGKIIDKITSMKTAGTDATTKQIKDLSVIPGDKMLETAKGIEAIKQAIDGFGGGTFSKMLGGLVGSGDDSSGVLAQLKLFSKADIDTVKVTNNAAALVAYSKAMSAAGGAQAAAGLGEFVGGALGSLGKFFGGDGQDPLSQLVKFGKSEVNSEQVVKNAAAMVAYSKAMLAGSDAGTSAGLSSFASGVLGSLGSFFGGGEAQDPLSQLKKFGETTINSANVDANAKAMGVYAAAMVDAKKASPIAGEALGAFVGGALGSLGKFFTGEAQDPLSKLVKFGETTINSEQVSLNAKAMGIYTAAMADAMKANPTVEKSLGGFVSGVMGSLGSFFGADSPLEKLKDFGDMKIDSAGVVKNAKSMLDYTAAISGVGASGKSDIDFFTDSIIKLKESLEKLSGKPTRSLQALARARTMFGDIDKDDIKSLNDEGLSIPVNVMRAASLDKAANQNGGVNAVDASQKIVNANTSTTSFSASTLGMNNPAIAAELAMMSR